jgi:GNAT superfamily N-acetyltransferase
MIQICRATVSDDAVLTQLMHQSSAYAERYRSILEGYAVSREQITSDHVYLAEQDGDVLGFYSLTAGAPKPDLDLLFVADAAQGKGIGARLFLHMKDLARSLGYAEVIIVSHPPAEGFYRRMGATRIGTCAPSGKVSWERSVLSLSLRNGPPAAVVSNVDMDKNNTL